MEWIRFPRPRERQWIFNDSPPSPALSVDLGPTRWWFCIREIITKKLRTRLLMCSTSIKIALLLNPGLASTRQKVSTRTSRFWNLKRACPDQRSHELRSVDHNAVWHLLFSVQKPPAERTGPDIKARRVGLLWPTPPTGFRVKWARVNTHTYTIAQIVVGFRGTRTRQNVT